MDYNTWTRKKINDKFEFPMELDVGAYVDQTVKVDPEDSIYELKAIVIHRGGPYGGHYYAYMKDDLAQGNWDREMP
jgi:ubiquitin C-terminal hydrolase